MARLLPRVGDCVPACEVRRGTVRGGQEALHQRIWVSGQPDGLVRQEELTERSIPVGTLRSPRVGKPFWNGLRVRVVGALGAATRPEPRARDLVRVPLHHDLVRAVRCPTGMQGRLAPGESGHGEVHGAPEEVNGTHPSSEARAERRECPIRVHELAPEGVRRIRVLTGVRCVLSKRDREFHLIRCPVDARVESELTELLEEPRREVSDRHGHEREHTLTAVAVPDHQLVLYEIELDVEDSVAVHLRPGPEASGCDVQRDVPPVVHVGRAHHADLAHDLQPTVQRIAGVGLAVHGKDGASRHSPDDSRANQAAAKRHSRPASVRNLRDI